MATFPEDFPRMLLTTTFLKPRSFVSSQHDCASHLDQSSRRTSIMASLADELLNDFEDSGSENGEQNGFMDDDAEAPSDLGIQRNHDDMNEGPSMELDDDEEEPDEAEEELAAKGNKDEAMEDEDETKAKVEKMKLGGVEDVRSVAGLMKQLQPVLVVSSSSHSLLVTDMIYIFGKAALTPRPPSRKSPTTKAFLPRNELRMLARSKTTRSTHS